VSKRTIEAIKYMGPVGERAIGVLVSVMETRRCNGRCASKLPAGRIVLTGARLLSVSLQVTRKLIDLTLDEACRRAAAHDHVTGTWNR